jgi:spore coat polysaccharide biosynthesis protein SpsF (cytidylyltransferase family)
MKKLGILIFARIDSKRLPGKVLKEITLEKNLLEIVYLRLKKFTNLKIVVCTSLSKKDDQIIRICKQRKISFFRGNLKNVFDRTINCLKKFKFDAFVRINADRPFVDFDEVNKMVKIFRKKKFDIITNQLSKKCPKGLACEIAKSEVFLKNTKKLSYSDKEHIFNFFYRNKKKYRIYNLDNKLYYKKIKKNLSIYTSKDLSKIKKIYKGLGSIYVPTKTILKII